MSLPTVFRRIFTGLHGLITFTFVCTVAYAATMGAFGNDDDVLRNENEADCGQRIEEMERQLTKSALENLKPYRSQRLTGWKASSQGWISTLNALKRACNKPTQKRRIKALGALQQAYSNAILGFDARARAAITTLESTQEEKK